MKIQKLLLSLLASAALFVACGKEKEPEPTIPQLNVDQVELTFEQGGGTGTITVTSNRPWSITTDADWLAFSPTQGQASDSPVSVTVTALANSSNDRTSSFKVKTDFDYRTVNVSQKGAKGEDPNTTPTGTGTQSDPYNVIAAIAAVADLSWTSNTEYQTTDVVYVKGIISRIAENGTFTGGGSFGNASFFISTDGTTNNEFQVYRCLYLGNKKYKSGQTDIKVGDEVIICGKLMNYKGNTPETDANNAYVYSLNGETASQGGEEPEAKGTGTLEDPYNPAGAAAAVKNLTWTSNTEYQTTDDVYVKGKISRIADNGTFTESGTFGNASFYIVEEGTDFEFYVFRALYLGNKKFEEGQTDIKVGDEVIICGKLMNYKGNTPETDANNAYVYSLNGETASQGGEEPEAKGTGTLEDPYNPAGAAAAVKNLTWTSNTEYQTTDDVYVKGKISRIADNGTFTESGTFGNASFYIVEEGTDFEFYVFRALYLGNKKFEEGQTDIKVGDEVIICGKLMNYRGNTPETEAGKAYVYSLNGETGGGSGEEETGEPKGTGTLEDPYNPAGAAAAVKDLTWTSNEEYESTGDVYVKGKISRIVNKGTYTESGTFGNASFFISEDGEQSGEFQVYRALYLGNKKFESGQTDIKVGDEVIIYGKLMNYRNNTPETVSGKCYLYSLNGVTGGDVPGPGGESEDLKTATIAEFLAAADSKTQPYKLTGKVGKIVNNTYGNFDLTDATGTVYVYGLVAKDLGGYGPNKANDKSFASIGIKEGDEITIIGYRETFTDDSGSKDEIVGSYYVSGASGGSDEPGGGETPGGDAEGGTISWTSGSSWTGVAEKAQTITLKAGTFTISAAKASGKTNPTVNGSANDCRVYAASTLTITTTGEAMTSIVFNISSQGQKRLTDITANTGSVAKQATGDKTVTWTGSAKTVTFTVGEKAVYGSDGADKAGQFDFSSIVIK